VIRPVAALVGLIGLEVLGGRRADMSRAVLSTGVSSRKCSISRRRFVQWAAAAVSVPVFVPAAALGRDRATAAGERITAAVFGLGDRGSTHIRALLTMEDVQIIGVCDPYRSKCEQRKGQIEKAYATRSGLGRYRGCEIVTDFRELLAREDLDTVFIASPEYWHGLQGAFAARAGKDIYGEKALTLTLAEGPKLVETVRRYGRVFQVGLQQRSSRNFRFACELVRNGYLGKLRTIKVGVPGGRALPAASPKAVPDNLDYEMWLGPAPYTPYNDLKCTYNWYFIYDYCVGWIQSWGVHHVDIAQWGAPSLTRGRLTVEGTATFPKEGLADTSLTWDVNIYTEDGVHLSFTDNRKNKQGCRFEGEKGWVHVNRSGIWAEPASLLKVELGPDELHLYRSNNHHRNFFDCVRQRTEPAAPIEAGYTATAITIMADIATRLRRRLVWDWASRSFVGDEEANRMCARAMRSPWSL